MVQIEVGQGVAQVSVVQTKPEKLPTPEKSRWKPEEPAIPEKKESRLSDKSEFSVLNLEDNG